MKDHGQNPDKGIKAGAAPVSFNEVEKLTEEKYTIRKYKRILFYVVICVLLAAFLLGQYIYPSEREPVTEESITYTGTFYRVLADGTKEEIPVPGKCDVPAGEPMVIRSVLPQDYHENTIAIRSSLENVRIYIGGELRAVYDTENTRPFGKILPVGMCSARHPARMRGRKCGLNCSPLPTSIPVSSTRYIVGINQISGHICSTAILW